MDLRSHPIDRLLAHQLGASASAAACRPQASLDDCNNAISDHQQQCRLRPEQRSYQDEDQYRDPDQDNVDRDYDRDDDRDDDRDGDGGDDDEDLRSHDHDHDDLADEPGAQQSQEQCQRTCDQRLVDLSLGQRESLDGDCCVRREDAEDGDLDSERDSLDDEEPPTGARLSRRPILESPEVREPAPGSLSSAILGLASATGTLNDANLASLAAPANSESSNRPPRPARPKKRAAAANVGAARSERKAKGGGGASKSQARNRSHQANRVQGLNISAISNLDALVATSTTGPLLSELGALMPTAQSFGSVGSSEPSAFIQSDLPPHLRSLLLLQQQQQQQHQSAASPQAQAPSTIAAIQRAQLQAAATAQAGNGGTCPARYAPSAQPNANANSRYLRHYTEACPICDRRFKSIKWLQSHVMNDHKNEIGNLFNLLVQVLLCSSGGASGANNAANGPLGAPSATLGPSQVGPARPQATDDNPAVGAAGATAD